MIDENKSIIFIDLDSTLIKTLSRKKLQVCIADCTPIWKTWNALRDWTELRGERGGWIFIVSNQGGIEKHVGSTEKFLKVKFEYITAGLQEYVDKSDSPKVTVDYIYCPTVDKTCPDRKPGTGMLTTILGRWNLLEVDRKEMIFIGDASGKDINPKAFSDSDLKCAENFGIDYLDVLSV